MFINAINAAAGVRSNYNQTMVKRNAAVPVYSVSFQSNDDYFDYDKELKKQLEQRNGWQKFWGTGRKKAKAEVEKRLIGFNMAKEALVSEKDKRILENQEIIKKQQETIEALNKLTKAKEAQLEEAKLRNADQRTILELKYELQGLKTRQAKEKAAQQETIKKNEDLKYQQETVTRREAGKGWEKIAGRDRLKDLMDDVFLTKIAQEKAGYDVNMPNGILLYGPPGTGKTRFAKAFAEQAGCRLVTIDTLQDDSDILTDLKDELKNSKKNYNSSEHPKQRTIILLDDFNSIAELTPEEKKELDENVIDFDDTNVGKLAEYLNDCANKYKATIFMTTNHPRRIDSELLHENLIPHQIFLGPPMTMDAAKILQYHLKGFTNQPVDYLKLGKEISKAFASEQAYSSQGIVNIVEYAKDHSKGSDITEDTLLDAIAHVKPDISSKTWNTFLDDMSDTLSRFKEKDAE